MKRTTIELPDKLHTQLKVLSVERSRTMNSMLVEAVESFLEKQRHEKND